MHIHTVYAPGRSPVLRGGDCRDLLRAMPDESVNLTITSPPYCLGKEYERPNKLSDFKTLQQDILLEVTRLTKPGGSICWQVGYYVKK